MRILIADDCEIVRQVLSAILKKYGVCDTASDGEKAVDMFRKAWSESQPYDLVCLDVSMPGMDGYDVLEAIRNFEEASSVKEHMRSKVLIITAFSDDDAKLRTYNLCEGYITKPVNREKLKEKLARLGFFPQVAPPESKAPASEMERSHDLYDMIPQICLEHGKIVFKASITDPVTDQKSIKLISPDKLEFLKNVMQGQMIARLVDHSIQIIPGDGIVFDEKSGVFSAQKNGLVHFEDNVLSVCDTLRISQMLYRSLDFLGRIIIDGSVVDGIHVNGTLGIVVNGHVGASLLTSRGDIKIDRIHGADKARIKCDGDFYADCVYNATVEARGSIYVSKESLHSVLKAGKTVKAHTVTGGYCVALDSIELGRVGSPKDLTTVIRAGEDFYLSDKISGLEKNIKELEAHLDRTSSLLGPYSSDISKAFSLAEDKKQLMFRLFAEKKRLETEHEELLEEYQQVIQCRRVRKDPVISVHEVMHKGVRLEMNDLQELVSDDIKGPFSVSEGLIRL